MSNLKFKNIEKTESMLKKQIEEHNINSPSKMMFHVGDIKSGGAPCNESVYKKVSGFLKKLEVPVFIVPGDNEWNDCDNPSQAWAFWEKYFLKFDKNWKLKYKVEYQSEQPENFSFKIKDILFTGINLVGGRVHDQDVWNEKMQNDVLWIKRQFQSKEIKAAVIFAQANPNEKHELFMKQFRNEAKIFNKPILFIHGDGHRWLYDNPWLEENVIRVQVDQGKIADPLQVSIIIDTQIKFEFEREPFK